MKSFYFLEKKCIFFWLKKKEANINCSLMTTEEYTEEDIITSPSTITNFFIENNFNNKMCRSTQKYLFNAQLIYLV